MSSLIFITLPLAGDFSRWLLTFRIFSLNISTFPLNKYFYVFLLLVKFCLVKFTEALGCLTLLIIVFFFQLEHWSGILQAQVIAISLSDVVPFQCFPLELYFYRSTIIQLNLWQFICWQCLATLVHWCSVLHTPRDCRADVEERTLLDLPQSPKLTIRLCTISPTLLILFWK